MDRHNQAIGSGQGVDGEHTQGRLTVQQDMGVLLPNGVQVLPQDGLTAHGVHQRYLHAGELNIRGHEIHTLRVVQDALAGGDGLIVQHLAHHVRKGDRQGVRLGMAQADGKAGLGNRNQ